MAEQVIYRSGNVIITPSIARFGRVTYQIANIGSVTIATRRKLRTSVILLFLLGLVLVFLFNINATIAFVGAASIVLACAIQIAWPSKEFTLVLKTSSGDIQAVTSTDSKYIEDLNLSIEDAFAARDQYVR
jgi:hypothetical protein